MSNIINNEGVPYPIYKAVINDGYTAGNADFSVTQLYDAPKKVYGDRIVARNGTKRNISDVLDMFEGSITHEGMEYRLKDDKEFITEKRLFVNIKVGDQTILLSGAFDCYCIPNKTLYDYKTTSAGGWKMRHKKMIQYSQQVNIYRILMKLNSYEDPQSIKIIFFVKGWNQIDAYSHDYPRSRFMEENVEKLSDEQVITLIKEKISILLQSSTTPYAEIPYCSPEQRWEDPPVWKVCKLDFKGKEPVRPRAVPKGIFIEHESAENFLKVKGKGYFIREFGGKPVRCLKYCQVGKTGICNFLKEYEENEKEISDEELFTK